MKNVIAYLMVILVCGMAYSAVIDKPCKTGIRIHRHRPSGDGKYEIYTFAVRTNDCNERLTEEYEFKKPVSKDTIKNFEKLLMNNYLALPTPTPGLDIEK